MPPIPVVSLFCGPGGMDLGFRQENFKTILAIDDSQAAVNTYNWNTPDVAVKEDIQNISSNRIVEMVKKASTDCTPRGVIGGPPCQSFSTGNVNKKKGDPRDKLGQEYARILKALNDEFELDFFVFENVLGLKASRHKRRKGMIFRALEAAGFSLSEHELDASAFGVPQKRRRLFIVGINQVKFPVLKFAAPGTTVKTPVTVRDTLAHLPAPTFFRRDLTSKDISHHPNHWAMNPKAPRFSTGEGFNDRSFRNRIWNRPSSGRRLRQPRSSCAYGRDWASHRL